MLCMRTTISIDENVLEAVKRREAKEGRSVSAYITRILDEAVKNPVNPPDETPFRLITVGGGGPFAGIDLDQPRKLMVADDERRYGK